MELTDEEHEVVTNIGGEETPSDPREIDDENLIAIHDRVCDVVQLSYEDDDVESLRLLLPIEEKVVGILRSRLG